MGQSMSFADTPERRSRVFRKAVLEGAAMLQRNEVRALADQLHTLARRMGEPLRTAGAPRDDGQSVWL